MPMAAEEIEALIRAALPDAVIDIRDLAGDGDHYAARVVSKTNSNSDGSRVGTGDPDVPVDLAAIAARGVNAGSLSSRANLTFHGHTDWETCRQTRFVILLGTGARTLRKPNA